MEEYTNNKQIIDLPKILQTLWTRRKVFYILWPTVLILSCIWILPQPRYYTCEVKLAPESGGSNVGNITGIASSFGLNIGSMATEDAIFPLLYPVLFKSPEFLVSLYDIRIRTADGKVETDYYTYRKEYDKHNPLIYPLTKAKKSLVSSISHKEQSVALDGMKMEEGTVGVNPFCMSIEDDGRMMDIIDDINCSVDKKTNVITISVKDHDRLVCALMADSVKTRLQEFITIYRTKKMREDAYYYRNLLCKAEKDYNEALITYSNYKDSHSGMTHQSQMSEAGRLKNEADLKMSTYNAVKAQLSTAEAKVQENTPAFTTLKSATVPVRPTGPKRELFVLEMLFFSTIITSCWLLRKELFWTLKKPWA